MFPELSDFENAIIKRALDAGYAPSQPDQAWNTLNGARVFLDIGQDLYADPTDDPNTRPVEIVSDGKGGWLVRYLDRKKHDKRLAAQFSKDHSRQQVVHWVLGQLELALVNPNE